MLLRPNAIQFDFNLIHTIATQLHTSDLQLLLKLGLLRVPFATKTHRMLPINNVRRTFMTHKKKPARIYVWPPRVRLLASS